MAFAKSTQARLPHFPGYPGTFTTLQTSFHNADRPVAPPRFDPGLSTGPGSFTTEDLGVSPDRTFTGWLTRVIARLRHDHSFAVVVIAPEQLDARGCRLRAHDTWHALTGTSDFNGVSCLRKLALDGSWTGMCLTDPAIWGTPVWRCVVSV